MKYIKKFEELSPATYANAAIALSKLGHHQRSKKLDDWRIDQVMKKYKDEWKNLISTYSKYGKAKVKITEHKSVKGSYGFQGQYGYETKYVNEPKLSELDYYLAINVDSELTEKLNKSLSISKDNIDIKIPLNISLIPIDESNEYGNFLNYYGLSLQIMKAGVYYTVDEGVLQFEGVSIDTSKVDKGLSQSNNGVDIDILDRKSAITIKNSILACFDETQDYIGIYQEDRMYDYINKNIISKNELDIDLNLTMDRIHQDIKSYSLNKLYKDSNN